MAARRTLLRELIDYAGMFPPAALALEQAAADYAAARAGHEAWALGRLIVPAARLSELAALLAGAPPATPWPISALAGADIRSDLRSLAAFEQHRALAYVDTLEVKAADAGALLAGEADLPAGLTVYVELPTDQVSTPILDHLHAQGLRAKVRCGGVTADAFPAPDALLAWLAAVVAAAIPFKATAGLHHPLRADYRLTYAPDSATAPMYGYLNLLLAVALLRAGAAQATARAALLESDPRALSWGANELTWRDQYFNDGELANLRAESMIAVGSCSFREPLDEIAQLYGAL